MSEIGLYVSDWRLKVREVLTGSQVAAVENVVLLRGNVANRNGQPITPCQHAPNSLITLDIHTHDVYHTDEDH